MKKQQDIDWKNLQVLVVDDQKIARDVLRDMLYDLGISLILEAKDGDEAQKVISDQGKLIDLVVCDWNMPTLPGIELLRQLRAAKSEIPFLMVTGRNDLASVIEAQKSGVTGYILKPFSLADLDDKITRILSKKPEA